MLGNIKDNNFVVRTLNEELLKTDTQAFFAACYLAFMTAY